MFLKNESNPKMGLTPLAHHIADCINQHIIWELEPDFEFAFTGIDAKAEAKERDARNVEVRGWKTINQILKEQELPTMGEEGDIILDPTFVQWKSQIQAQADEAQSEAPGLSESPEGGSQPGLAGSPDLPGAGKPATNAENAPGGEGGEPASEAMAASLAVIRDVEQLRKSLPSVEITEIEES